MVGGRGGKNDKKKKKPNTKIKTGETIFLLDQSSLVIYTIEFSDDHLLLIVRVREKTLRDMVLDHQLPVSRVDLDLFVIEEENSVLEDLVLFLQVLREEALEILEFGDISRLELWLSRYGRDWLRYHWFVQPSGLRELRFETS